MKAIRVEKTGGPEVLKLVEVEPIGQPGPGQAVVKMMCAGINFMDVGQRRGTYPAKFPLIPGAEGSGIVEAIGEGVINVKVSDRVAFTGVPGAYAEMVLAPAERLISLPDDFTFEQGAAFPLQGMTAHYLIHDFKKPKTGDVVLIHAAAGGVGGLLVQYARHLGATVIGTASSAEKAKSVYDAGADYFIDYTKQDFTAEVKRLTEGHGADLIIDSVGKTTFIGDLEAAAVHGHIIVFGGASGSADSVSPNSLMARSLSVSGGSLPNHIMTREDLLRRSNKVIEGIREGWLKLKMNHAVSLAQAAKAHEMLESRKTEGKLLLSVVESPKAIKN